MECDWDAFENESNLSNEFRFGGVVQTIDVNQTPFIPPQSRKRTLQDTGFTDEVGDLLMCFDRKLKLSKNTRQRLKIADAAAKDPSFAPAIMQYLPESALRTVAVTCREWRNLALEVIRKRKGNRSFSILWLDKNFLQHNHGDANVKFSFITYFHPTILGHPEEILDSSQNSLNEGTSNGLVAFSSSPPSFKMQYDRHQATLKTVNMILTYGTGNMSNLFLDSDLVEGNAMYPENCVGLYALSSSVVVSSPDNKKLVDALPGDTSEDRLVSSVMFPACSHLAFETFLVPAYINAATYPCISEVVGDMDATKTPKVLIIYQCINLANSEPGIVDVLQSLKSTAGSTGFPMVTGIYEWIHGKLSGQEEVCPVASGLLISGDNLCSAAVVEVNLMNLSVTLEADLSKIMQFYDINFNCNCKHALLFYHNALVAQDVGMFPFRGFLTFFHSKLPDVLIHGLGSLTGAHAMFVNANSAASWNDLNLNMVKCGAAESTLTSEAYRLVFVLLAYQAD